jgi:hypothetical protein
MTARKLVLFSCGQLKIDSAIVRVVVTTHAARWSLRIFERA